MENLLLKCVVISVPLFASGFVMIHPKHGMPWCFDIALSASGFMLLGMASRKLFIIFTQQKMLILCITLAFSLSIFSAGTIFSGNDLELIFMCAGDYGSSIFRFMINSLSGIALILSLSSVISRLFCRKIKKDIAYIGRNTIGNISASQAYSPKIYVCPYKIYAG